MRVLSQNEKTGEIKVQVESQDDVWHIHNIIEKGDIVSAMTYRRADAKMSGDKLRPDRAEKKKMYLGIEVEDTEYHEFTERLRITGTIVDGPQDLGQHHTINLQPGDSVGIKKDRWQTHHLDRIKEAVSASKRPLITFLSIDDDEAVIAVLRQSGLQHVCSIQSHVPGKDFESGQSEMKKAYFGDVLAALGRIFSEGTLMIIGPGFTKEELYAYAREKKPALVKNCELRATGQSGLTGINELLKSGVDVKILEGQRAAFEIKKVEELLEEIAKGGKYAYGTEQIKDAVSSGAVEVLLVLDKHLHNKETEELMRMAENSRGKIIIVSNQHEGGRKLESLGGIAAILRYRMDN